MLNAKLFVLDQEINLLKTDMSYSRSIDMGTGAMSKVVGGKISLTFETLENSHDLMNWITRAKAGSSTSEKSKMEEGKVCFYEDGFDNPPTKTYAFNDAYLVRYREFFNSKSAVQMLTSVVISPAIQNYGAETIEAWNVSYIAPSEAMPPQKIVEVIEHPKIIEAYFEDFDGNRIKELVIGTEVFLVVSSENCSGKTVNINLSDRDHDFMHDEMLLEDDMLKDITLSGDIHKERLIVVADHSDTTEGDESGSETSPQNPSGPNAPSPEKVFSDYFLTNASGKKVEKYDVGDTIILNVKTKNRIGDKLTIHLEDKTHDFKYKGEVLKDKLSDFTITKDEEKIELEVMVQSSKS